ncbi:MAG TPA: hypothetical protein VLG11_02500 [Candidatus Saccharimonadales bacterium]|nr:hypothetical protein [Candidatus Saccharimonadales bacterium]
MKDSSSINKNAKHKFDVLYKIWLERRGIVQTYEVDQTALEKDMLEISEVLEGSNEVALLKE